MIKRFILSLLLLFPLIGFSHPVHISVCDIHYNSDSNSFQISIRMFSDDLELGIRETLEDKILDIGFETESQTVDSLIGIYLNSYFQVNILDSIFKAQYLGKESEGMSTWCYLELDVPREFDHFSIKNSLLDKHFEDQKNMVHFYHNGNVSSLVFDKNKRKQTIRITNQ